MFEPSVAQITTQADLMNALANADNECAFAIREAVDAVKAVSGNGSHIPGVSTPPGTTSPHPAGPGAAATAPTGSHASSLPGAESGQGSDADEAKTGGAPKTPLK